jgi:cell division protein FtsB
MENAETVLVILLSVTLIIFLVVAIILSISIIKLTRILREIAEKAQVAVSNVEAATLMLKKTAGPLAIGKFLTNIIDVVINRKKRR